MQIHGKRVAFWFVGALILLLTTQAAAENVTLQVMHRWGGDRLPLLRNILDLFEKAHPGVKVEDIEVGASLNQKLTVNWLGGTGPDIAMVNMSSAPGFGEQGLLLPLDPFAKAEGTKIEALIYPGIAQDIVYAGQRYYLPMTINVGRHLMYYNRGLFAQAGVNPDKPPTTHSQWLEAAKKLTRVNSDGSYALRGVDLIYNNNNERNYMVVEAMVEQRGLGFFDQQGTKVLPDIPGVLAVMNWMLDFNQKLGGFLANGADSGRDRFEKKEVAMYQGIDGDWFLFTQTNPEIDLGLAPLPIPDGEPMRTKVESGWGWGISSSTKYPKLAWELLKWLSVDRKGGGWFIQQQGRMSSNPVMNRDPEYLKINPYWNVLGTVANAGTPGGKRCVNLTAGEVYNVIGTILPNAVLGKAEPQSALMEARRILEAKCGSK